MIGTTAQIISLVSYGNEFLLLEKDYPDYFLSNSTFKYCNLVYFKENQKIPLLGSPREKVVAKDPLAWFRYLRRNGCRRLKLYYQPSRNQAPYEDHKTAGFVGGGGTWAIETIYDRSAYYWPSNWEVTQKDDPNRNVWSVSYTRTFYHLPLENKEVSLQVARDSLVNALEQIIVFAESSNLGGWTSTFRTALVVLHSNDPDQGRYYSDCLVQGKYSLEARQLFFAAAAAWVFGGMGSWNDCYFNDKELNENYDHVSAALYSAINEAFLASVNFSE
jgi:hypothetical protein